MYIYRDQIFNPIFGVEYPYLFANNLGSLDSSNFWTSSQGVMIAISSKILQNHVLPQLYN